MRTLSVAIALVGGAVLANSSAAYAGDGGATMLTREQMHAYHACLYEAWLHDWCHTNSLAYPQCVLANAGGRYNLDGRRFTEDYCWYTAQGLPPR